MSRFESCLAVDCECCDLGNLVFIDAFGLVATAACILSAAESGDVPRVILPRAPQTHEHLAAMGFLRFLSDIGQEPEPRGTPSSSYDVVVPLTRLATVFEAEQLSQLLWAHAAQWDPQVLEALTEGLWELVANALEHSGADALLMGQVYRYGEPPDHDRRVQIAIGDAGRGIRASFLESGTKSPRDDAEAIELALSYLVSSVPDPGRGQGLPTAVEQAIALEGRVVLRTGAARATVDADGSRMEHVEAIGGTVVGISLPLYPGRHDESP